MSQEKNENNKSTSNSEDLEPSISKKVKFNDFSLRKNSSCFSYTTNDTSQYNQSNYSPSSMNIEADEKMFDADEFFLNGLDEEHDYKE